MTKGGNMGVKKGSMRGSYKKDNPKTKTFGGYKYTEDEYLNIKKALSDYKIANNCTTSKAIYDLLTK